MAENNRPRSREKNITGQGAGVHRRGEGLGTGPVGSGSNPTGQSSRPGQRSSGERNVTRSGGGKSPLFLIIILVLLLFGGGGGLGNMLGLLGGGSDTSTTPNTGSGTGSYDTLLPATPTQSVNDGTSGSDTGKPSLAELLLGGGGSWTGGGSSTWTGSVNTGTLNREVAPGSRAKFTKIKGDGSDQVTVMVYMCGTDLESRSGMASRDLAEMGKAALSDNVNLLVCTGGCKQWQTRSIRNDVNQIFQIKDGYLVNTGKTAGSSSMTDPNTMLSFIRYCKENYPANRYMLILWDHGGGSLSGYGYDEKFANTGSMNLATLSSVLKSSGLKYDVIGFDACLMATVENASMLSSYADYLIASEETEPGIGWYYTNWLTELSANPGMSTLDLGQMIVDDFVAACNRQCAGQPTTLSVVDLAELAKTLPADMKAFSESLKDMITGGEYQMVSNARGNTKEFASSTRIDQVDFVDFAQRIGTAESDSLAQVLRSAVKYNRTSGSVTNAYGLSVYFPLRRMSNVDKAVQTYDALGMDSSYTDCVRAFASMETGGQLSSGGSSNNPYASLFGDFTSGYSNYTSYPSGSYGSYGAGSSSSGSSAYGSSASAVGLNDLLNAFMGGDMSSLLGLSSSDYFTGRSLGDTEAAAEYLAENLFDPSQLYWQRNADGDPVISMDAENWQLVQDVALNLFFDDGEGYVDLGLDNQFSFDENGNMLPDTSGSWISLNNQPVAYYYTGTAENDDGSYAITGYVPALLNGDRVKLILIFTDEQPHGYVAGAQPDYSAEETETVSRGLIELSEGDRLEFLCDFYTYNGQYQDSYLLNDPIIYDGTLTVSDTYLGGSVRILYRFTDIYDQNYWSEAITLK